MSHYITPCFTNMLRIRVIFVILFHFCFLSIIFGGVFNKTVIASSALRASLHLISNARDWNNCLWYNGPIQTGAVPNFTHLLFSLMYQWLTKHLLRKGFLVVFNIPCGRNFFASNFCEFWFYFFFQRFRHKNFSGTNVVSYSIQAGVS